MKQAYAYGELLRQRYAGFLPQDYSRFEVSTHRYNLPHFQQLTSDPCVPGGAEDHSDLFSVNCKWMGVGVNG